MSPEITPYFFRCLNTDVLAYFQVQRYKESLAFIVLSVKALTITD